VGGEIYSEISTWLWCIVAVTGDQYKEQRTKSKKVADFWIQENQFII